jgi:steroid 5-alpha reductase family enzyme
MRTTGSIFLLFLVATASSAFSTGGLQSNLRRPQGQQEVRKVPKNSYNRKISTLATKERKSRSRLRALPLVGVGVGVGVAPHVWTSLVPPCMGFYKSEYTVSLGFGFAVALTAISLFRQFGATTANPLVALHASALVFYGVRLNLFLILRNIWSTRVQEFNSNIEDRAVARGNRWTTRVPFVLSCGLLYYGLSIPLWFTGKLMSGSAAGAAVAIPTWTNTLLKGLIGAQWLGFGIAALGDLTKTYVKRSEKNERYLVTSGIFSLIRHPNYTGEILGWTSNALAGLVAAGLWIATLVARPSVTTIANLGALVLGWIGFLFVLLRATNSLEARQKTDYGDTSKYQKWVASSWGGWQLPAKQDADAADHATPHLELDDTAEEDSGSGI